MKQLIESVRCGVFHITIYLPFAVILVAPQAGNSADLPQNAGYFFEQAVRYNPTIHDIGERIRIARGIDPDRIAEFTGMHEAVSYPGDTDPDAEDFREEALGQLRSEIRMAYAELASVRSQMHEVRRIVGLLRQTAETANTLYANGRLDQAQAVKAQIEWEKQTEAFQLLGKRERIFSIRLSVLSGLPMENALPPLHPLAEYAPNFNDESLVQAYKSRRFLELFQQLIRIDSPQSAGEGLHGGNSLDLEARSFIAVVRLSLESLSQRAARYRSTLIPRGELAYATRLDLYQNGKLDFAMLMESLMALSEMRREYLALLGESHVLKAKVEYLTGIVLD